MDLVLSFNNSANLLTDARQIIDKTKELAFRSVMDAAFKGIRPVVVALMFAPIIGFTKGMRGYTIAIAAAISLIIWYVGISPVYILFAGGVVGVLLAALRGKEVKR